MLDQYLTGDNIANGIALAVFGILSGIGLWSGARGKKPKGGNVEIAGALIDGRDARGLVSALDRNTAALDRNSQKAEDAAQAAAVAAIEVRRMADEMIRGGRS